MLRRLMIGVVSVGLLLAATRGMAQKSYVILHDEASVKAMIDLLTEGAGAASLEKADVWKDDADGKAALKVTGAGGDAQKFRTNVPGWAFQIKDKPDPKSDKEFRYITWAWKKVGGTGIQLQLHAPDANTWGHRYHGGVNALGWNPSLEVNPKLDTNWASYTRDLFKDWKEFTLDGIAFSQHNLDFGLWDHVVLHQTPDDPLAAAKAVDPKGKLPVAWGNLKTLR